MKLKAFKVDVSWRRKVKHGLRAFRNPFQRDSRRFTSTFLEYITITERRYTYERHKANSFGRVLFYLHLMFVKLFCFAFRIWFHKYYNG